MSSSCGGDGVTGVAVVLPAAPVVVESMPQVVAVVSKATVVGAQASKTWLDWQMQLSAWSMFALRGS